MKLATTTGDFSAYTTNPCEAIRYIREAGFRYADYNFHMDAAAGTGIALHIQDNLGDKDSHIAPFFGTLNLDSLMHGLSDTGYKGYFTFEASNMLLPAKLRRSFSKDQRLACAPLELRVKAEMLLYEIGRTALKAYGKLEE